MSWGARLSLGLAGLAVFVLPGLCLGTLSPRLSQCPFWRRLGWAYLAGVCYVGGTLYALSAALDVRLGTSLVALVALAPAALLLRSRRGLPAPDRATRWSATSVTAVLIGAVLTAFVLAEAVAFPVTDWDGRMHWCAQARYVRAAGGVYPEALTQRQWFVDHPRYPLLLPLVQVTVQTVTGVPPEEDRVARVAYAAFLPAFLLLVYEGALALAGRRAAALTCLMAATVPLLLRSEGGAAGAYSDLPLACFLGGALILLSRGRPRAGDAGIAGLLLLGAALSKNEGAVLGTALVLFVAVRQLSRRGRGLRARLLPSLAGLAGVAAGAAVLTGWASRIPNRFDESYLTLVRNPPHLAEAARRLGAAWRLGVGQMLDAGSWGALWILAPILLALGASTKRWKDLLLLLAVASAPLALGCAAYVVNGDPRLPGVTWDRLLLQGLIPVFLAVSLGLRRVARGAPGEAQTPPGRSFSRVISR